MFRSTATRVSSPPMKTKKSSTESNNITGHGFGYDRSRALVDGEGRHDRWVSGMTSTGGRCWRQWSDPEASLLDEPPIVAVGQCSRQATERRRPESMADSRPLQRRRRHRGLLLWRPSGGKHTFGSLIHVLVFTVVFIDLFNLSASSSILRASDLDLDAATAAADQIYGRGR